MSLCDAFDFEGVFLFLPQQKGLRYATSCLPPPTKPLLSSLKTLTIKIDKNPKLKQAFREKKTFQQSNPQKTFSKDRDLKKLAKVLDLKKVIVVPLVLADENLGLILIQEGKQQKFKEKSSLAALDTFADSAALALENAHLYGDTFKTAENYRTILEQMGDGILMVEPDHQISFYNERAREMLGFPKEELLGKQEHDVLNIFDPKGKRLCGQQNCFLSNMAKSGIFSGEAFIEPADKRWLPVFLHARTIRNVKGAVVGTFLIFTNQPSG